MFVPIYLVHENSCTLKFSNVTHGKHTINHFCFTKLFFPFEILSRIYLVWFIPPLEVGFPGSSDGKESACDARDPGLIPGSERSLEKGTAAHSNILA